MVETIRIGGKEEVLFTSPNDISDLTQSQIAMLAQERDADDLAIRQRDRFKRIEFDDLLKPQPLRQQFQRNVPIKKTG